MIGDPNEESRDRYRFEIRTLSTGSISLEKIKEVTPTGLSGDIVDAIWDRIEDRILIKKYDLLPGVYRVGKCPGSGEAFEELFYLIYVPSTLDSSERIFLKDAQKYLGG